MPDHGMFHVKQPTKRTHTMTPNRLSYLFAAQRKIVTALWAVATNDRGVLQSVLTIAIFRLTRAGLGKTTPELEAINAALKHLEDGAKASSERVRQQVYRAANTLNSRVEREVADAVSRETTDEPDMSWEDDMNGLAGTITVTPDGMTIKTRDYQGRETEQRWSLSHANVIAYALGNAASIEMPGNLPQSQTWTHDDQGLSVVPIRGSVVLGIHGPGYSVSHVLALTTAANLAHGIHVAVSRETSK